MKPCPICEAPAGFHDREPHNAASALIDVCPAPNCHRHRPDGVCPDPGHSWEDEK